MEDALPLLPGTVLPRTLLRALPGGAPPDAIDLQSSALQTLGNSRGILEQAKCVVNNSDPMHIGSKVDAAVAGTSIHQPQERRKGLNRKRARFSMKPVERLLPNNINMEPDLEHVADPEQYFAAFEKFEIANKELKKLRGQDSSDIPEHQVAAVRKRRPGLLRRTATYRHSFEANADDVVDHLSANVSSLTSSQLEVSESDYKDPGKDNLFSASQEANASEEVFSCNIEGKEPTSEKENRVGNLFATLLSSFECLDDLDGAALLQEQLQLKKINLGKVCLPVTPADLKKTLRKKEREHRNDKLQLILGTPSHDRSPLALIPLLHEYSSHKDQVCLPVTPADEIEQLDNLKDAQPSSHTSGSFSHKETDDPEHPAVFYELEEAASLSCISMRNDDSSQELFELQNNKEANQEPQVEDPDALNSGVAASIAAFPLENGVSEASCTLTLENNEEFHDSSEVPKGNPEANVPRRRLKRALDTSLADAGSIWVSGLRRSTRNRVRPLEFWRGEKLLYGRIHDSLTTVIGVKYSSPRDCSLKVKSFVSDAYADLVERVSLH